MIILALAMHHTEYLFLLLGNAFVSTIAEDHTRSPPCLRKAPEGIIISVDLFNLLRYIEAQRVILLYAWRRSIISLTV